MTNPALAVGHALLGAIIAVIPEYDVEMEHPETGISFERRRFSYRFTTNAAREGAIFEVPQAVELSEVRKVAQAIRKVALDAFATFPPETLRDFPRFFVGPRCWDLDSKSRERESEHV